MLNKILGVIVSKASKPGPKLSLYQKAYVNECSCFLISSLMDLYPAFAAKMSPSKLEHLLGKFLQACKQTRSKPTHMKGGTLALRKHRKKIGMGSLFSGFLILLYAMFVARASIEQLNEKNPFQKGEYQMLNLVKEEAFTFQVTRDNIMRWVREPSVVLAEGTNTLLMKAVKIVNKVTSDYTEGLEQAVSDHCMMESSGAIPELRNKKLEVPEQEEIRVPGPAPQTAPETMPEEPSRWSSFASKSWSAFSGAASGADQAIDRLAKVHLAAVNLFDMPGCIQRVHDYKYQEFLDKLKNEHARLKLDIHSWGKKGQNDIQLIFTLFKTAIGLILGAFGISATRLLNKDPRSRIGESYNINRNAIEESENSPPQVLARQPSLRPLLGPSAPPSLVMPQLASNQPYLQMGPLGHLSQPLLQMEDQHAKEERERRAILDAQDVLQRVIRPAMNSVEQKQRDMRSHRQRVVAEMQRKQEIEAEEARRSHEERREQMQRSIAYMARQQEIAAEQSRQRQAEFDEIKRRADEFAEGMRKRR